MRRRNPPSQPCTRAADMSRTLRFGQSFQLLKVWVNETMSWQRVLKDFLMDSFPSRRPNRLKRYR
jgi:hypothetical protein